MLSWVLKQLRREFPRRSKPTTTDWVLAWLLTFLLLSWML